MPDNKVIIVSKDNIAEIKLQSKVVVICLEIIGSFAADGRYIPSDISKGRMKQEEVNKLYIALYSKLLKLSFKNPKKLQRMKPKKILKLIRPAHPFIIGIYRKGTPRDRFKSMRVDESVSDNFILEQFAIEFKESLVHGISDYVTNFTKQYYGDDEDV
jgi:hypothetical protein